MLDDVLPPWRPRFIEIKADVELLQSGGQGIVENFSAEMMRLRPVRIAAFGLEPNDFTRLGPGAVNTRKVQK